LPELKEKLRRVEIYFIITYSYSNALNTPYIPLRTIPVLGRVPAGFPDQIPSQEIIEYISCPDAQPSSYALIIKGDSITPTIKDDDYVSI
jgi:SOS-response transcriptional repressor LexA